jgi:hypothetical protein
MEPLVRALTRGRHLLRVTGHLRRKAPRSGALEGLRQCIVGGIRDGAVPPKPRAPRPLIH